MPDLSVYRPGGARYVAYGTAVILIVMTWVIGAALPEAITFTAAELFTLALVLLGTLALLRGVGRSVVRARPEGIEIVNGYRRHRLPWAQVRGISFKDGAPWPTLVTTDDERIMLFAIQRSDGPSSRAAVRELRARLES